MVMKKRLFNQLVAYVLCFCMIFGLSAGFPTSVLASGTGPENSGKQMTDIYGHWAQTQLNNWVNKDLISGFPDETFKPNNSITRAEFMALVNRAYGFSEKAAINFSDVSKGDWFYDDVAKAVDAGYIVGYDDGTAGARNNINRQEAAAVIYRLMKLPEHSSKDAIAKFFDYGSISAWSREAVNSVVAEGYMVGNPNGTFGPVNNITRAETVVTLSRATGEIYNAAGTYSEVRTIKGNATINTTGITLDGAVVEGNLYLTPGIGDGTVILRNVTVKGTTVIAGGGKNSVILQDCELNKVVVSREDGIVRISAQGGTSIQIVVVEAGAILDSALLSEAGGILTVYVTADEAVELLGDFGTVHVENPGAVITVSGGSVENLIIAETAAGSSVNLSQTASVANMEINAPVTVTGQGTIENAVIGEGAAETTFENEPVSKGGPGSTSPSPSTPTSTTPGGSTGSGGSSGGGTSGGSTSTTVKIAAISGVTVPATGQTPVTTITETAQYTGVVTWSPADGSFAASTAYTATIILTAKSGYRLNGVAANFFTVAGATSVSNAANSGVVTAVFPATAAPGPEKSIYDILFDPSGIEAGVAKEVEITLKAVDIKDEGYDLVRINVSVTEQPSNSTVALTGNYGDGPVDVIALGYWGPETGHPVAADYDESYNLIARFSEPGQYTLAVSLRDMNEGTDMSTKNVTITVAEAAIPTYTLTLIGNSISSDPAAGAIEENTEVTITVSPPAGKQVSTFAVNGVNKKTELMADPAHQYGFSMNENTTVAVTYEDIPAGITPPALNADSTQNYAGQNLMITFSDGVTWANAITEISAGGEILVPAQYNIVPGTDGVDGYITLLGGGIDALKIRGDKEIKVKSAGYTDAVVTQQVTASYFDDAVFSTQPAGPAANGGLLVTQPVVSLYDQYDNPCIDGPDSAREITLQKATGDTWSLGGTVTVTAVEGVTTFTNLTASNSSGLAITDARLMYEVVGSPNEYFYSDEFTIPGATGLTAPTLTADTSDNYAGANITITLQSGDWDDWINAITAVKVENDTLTTSGQGQYNIGAGIMTLLTANINQLQTPGIYTITVEASGYNNAVVSQNITAGPQASAVFTIQPLGPAVSGGQLQQQPIVTLYDTYGNICADGPSASAPVTLQSAVGDSWTIGGTNTVNAVNGVAAFTDLTATNPGGAEITDARMGYTFQGVTTYSNNFIVPGLGSQIAPALTPDTTNNYAGNIIEITFVDDPAWRAAVNSIILVKDGSNQLFNSPGVTLAEGKLTLDTMQITHLQERDLAGSMISIAAPNYETTWVYQPITSGITASISVDAEPQGPAANGGVFQSAPAISLSDAYGNPCIDGPSSGAAVTAAKLDAGDWTLGGTTTSTASQGTVAFGDLSAVNYTDTAITTAQIRFTVDGTTVMADSAVFTIPFGFTLTLAVNPEGEGTATIDAGGSSGLYLAGTAIAVTAVADQDYEFVNWTVGSTQVSDQESFTYTMPGANITLRANFQPTGTLTPPPLTPDTTDNYAGEVIWLEFPEGLIYYDYADAIYALEIGGIEYTNTEETTVFGYFFSGGQYILRLFTGNIPPLQTRDTYEITVKATGYSHAVVTQLITAAVIREDECVTLTGPESDQTYSSGQPLPEIKLQLRDSYGNPLIDGPDAGITLTAEIPQGYGGACILDGTLTAAADANGQITFNDIVVNLGYGMQQDSLTLKFTGTSSLGYGVKIYLTESGTGNWIVFTVAEQP